MRISIAFNNHEISVIRILTVAALAVSLTACGPGAGGDDDRVYTSAEWFPVGTWEIDTPGFLENSIMVIAPPILDRGLDTEGDRLFFDPRIDYGVPYGLTVYQPYTLQGRGGPILCYHRSIAADIYDGPDYWGRNALHDATQAGPVFVKQYDGTKAGFTGSVNDKTISTRLSIEDVEGGWLSDHDVEGTLLGTIDYETTLEVQKQIQELNVRTGCEGGFNDEFSGVNMPELVKDMPAQGRTTLDLKRQPLQVGKTYDSYSDAKVTILSENGDTAQVSLTGRKWPDTAEQVASGPGPYKTVQTTAIYSVKNGVQYWTLDQTLQAFQEIQPPPTGINSVTGKFIWPPRTQRLIAELSGFGMVDPSPNRFPDYQAYSSFPDKLKATGTSHYYGECMTCVQPLGHLFNY